VWEGIAAFTRRTSTHCSASPWQAMVCSRCVIRHSDHARTPVDLEDVGWSPIKAPGRLIGGRRGMQAGCKAARPGCLRDEDAWGRAVEGLTGEPGSVLLVRPVPRQRATMARLLLAAHPVAVGSELEPGPGGPAVVVWELCDPAAGDEPPRAAAATRPHESGAVEVLAAAAVPGGAAAPLLRRLFADVAAALRPAGHPMLIAWAPAEAETLAVLRAAGFAARPGFAGPQGHPPGAEAGQRDAMWFTMES